MTATNSKNKPRKHTLIRVLITIVILMALGVASYFTLFVVAVGQVGWR